LVALSAPIFSSLGLTHSEYTSPASWDSAANGVTIYAFPPPTIVSDGVAFPVSENVFRGESGQTFGPGTFATPGNVEVLHKDGLYGNNVSYVSADPGVLPGGGSATVVVSLNASDDVAALAFDLGSDHEGATISIPVNGSVLAPFAVSTAFPTALIGVTDTSGPIRSITFTSSPVNIPAAAGAMDVIGSYATAKAVATAPEIDPTFATSGITLLFAGLAMLHKSLRVTEASAADGAPPSSSLVGPGLAVEESKIECLRSREPSGMRGTQAQSAIERLVDTRIDR
jgi:hypothetical protein